MFYYDVSKDEKIKSRHIDFSNAFSEFQKVLPSLQNKNTTYYLDRVSASDSDDVVTVATLTAEGGIKLTESAVMAIDSMV